MTAGFWLFGYWTSRCHCEAARIRQANPRPCSKRNCSCIQTKSPRSLKQCALQISTTEGPEGTENQTMKGSRSAVTRPTIHLLPKAYASSHARRCQCLHSGVLFPTSQHPTACVGHQTVSSSRGSASSKHFAIHPKFETETFRGAPGPMDQAQPQGPGAAASDPRTLGHAPGVAAIALGTVASLLGETRSDKWTWTSGVKVIQRNCECYSVPPSSLLRNLCPELPRLLLQVCHLLLHCRNPRGVSSSRGFSLDSRPWGRV